MPLDPKLTKFTTAQERIIASYTTTEFAEGTGIVKFFGYEYADSTGTKYAMSQTPFFSRKIESSFSTSGSTLQTPLDADFDLAPFNRSLFMLGTATIMCGVELTGSNGVNLTATVTATVYHVDAGGTETTIGSTISGDIERNIAGVEQFIPVFNVSITRTHFAIGEKLRVRIEFKGQGTGGGLVEGAIGHDPQNRDGTMIAPSNTDVITRLEFHLPFEVPTG